MVMNLTALRSHEDNYVLEDIGAVREAAGKDILKVIIEAPQLTEEEIRRAVNLCIRAVLITQKQAQLVSCTPFCPLSGTDHDR